MSVNGININSSVSTNNILSNYNTSNNTSNVSSITTEVTNAPNYINTDIYNNVETESMDLSSYSSNNTESLWDKISQGLHNVGAKIESGFKSDNLTISFITSSLGKLLGNNVDYKTAQPTTEPTSDNLDEFSKIVSAAVLGISDNMLTTTTEMLNNATKNTDKFFNKNSNNITHGPNGEEITTTYNEDGSYIVKIRDFKTDYDYTISEKSYNANGTLLKESTMTASDNGKPSVIEYYENGNVKNVTGSNDSYQQYNSNGLLIEEKKNIDSSDTIYGEDNIFVKYDESGNVTSMTREDGTIFREYNTDGSFIQYDRDGAKLYEENADGSSKWFVNYSENGRPYISYINDEYDSTFSQEKNTSQDILIYDENHNLVEKQRIYTNGDIRLINSEVDTTYNSNGNIISENKEYGKILYENGQPVSLDITQRPFGGYSMGSAGGVTTITPSESGATYTFRFNEDQTKLISIEDYSGNITTFENGIDFIK